MINTYDLAIIGGGINGAGIARDAAGRGLKVLLCEKNDLASATSSYSSKLIHGGLRYLEYYEFRLVREALQEREKLLTIAPHLISPLEFIMPHQKQMRPAWLIRMGLFLYDHLAKRNTLPSTKTLKLKNHLVGAPLSSTYTKGFSYYDCFVDDARLVIANAKSARELGATILTYTECINLEASSDKLWHLKLHDKQKNKTNTVTARALVNASGPWLNQLCKLAKQEHYATPVKLIKGSHIIVPKLYEGNHAYILQNLDKRVVFVIPFQQNFSLIGTTDIPYSEEPALASISTDEITYLCSVVNIYFKKKISSSDVIHTFSGIRALQQDDAESPSAMTRDYKLDLLNMDKAPFLNIAGGKITTYRRLAEHALDLLAPYFALSPLHWTDKQPVSGGNLPKHSISEYFKQLSERYPWISQDILFRYIKQYGDCCETLLANCKAMADLGHHFGHGLYEIEINYLISQEWAVTVDDILWRRTKLGLKFTEKENAFLRNFLTSH